MKAVLLEIPDAIRSWMDERARLGHDRFDEMWEGVLHMVPPPGGPHQDRSGQLIMALGPLAQARDLRIAPEMGVFDPGRTDSYRQPDVAVYRAEMLSARGIEGRAELVVEIRSPWDESWEKLPFFAAMGIPEVLIVEPTEAAVLVLRADGSGYDRVTADADGFASLAVLPVGFRVEAEGGLVVRTATGDVRI